MTAFELYPAIDVRDGRVVRLVQGDYERETRYPADPVDLGQVLAMTLTTVRPLAEAAGVELQLDAARSLVVPGDADQLTQVFQNLIENAVKYGGAGKRVFGPRPCADKGQHMAAPAVLIGHARQQRGCGQGTRPVQPRGKAL